MKKNSQLAANTVQTMLMKKASTNEKNKDRESIDPTQIALYQTEIELLKKRVAILSKTRSAWIATSIILFAMFVITLGLKLA